ncbi:MAG: T9SS type A sorting domain-containing protein [Microscillaceae bacterium]|nr:T9SS type A sorting domain-containing protein [Microscillaceae bacterium]MDW8460966.1 T9SS type A sorting domain-containing protein [Cytophagales bacterium]
MLHIHSFAQICSTCNSTSSGNWDSPATWGGYTPANNAIITINPGHTVTSTSALDLLDGQDITVSAGGNLILKAGNTFPRFIDITVNGMLILEGGSISATTSITVNGTLRLEGGSINTTILSFNNASVYEHARDGGMIPFASWNINSTCRVVGIVSSPITGGVHQTFGNFEWNCPSQNIIQNVPAGPNVNIKKDFRIIHTGTASFNLGAGFFFVDGLTTVGTNGFLQDTDSNGGNFFRGDVVVDGKWDTSTLLVNVHLGNGISGGNITHNNPTPNSFLAYELVFTTPGRSLNGAPNAAEFKLEFLTIGNFTPGITNNHKVNIKNLILNPSNGSFIQGNGSILRFRDASQILPIPNPSLTDFHTNPNLVEYIGENGDIFPDDYHSLGINTNNSSNTKILTGGNILVNHSLSLTNGKITLNNNNLIYGGSEANLTRTNGWVETNGTGAFVRSTGGANLTFPVGNASHYQPVRLLNAAANASVRYGAPSVSVPMGGPGSWYIFNTASSQISFISPSGSFLYHTSTIHRLISGIWSAESTTFSTGTYTTNNLFFLLVETEFSIYSRDFYTLDDFAAWNSNSSWSLDGTTLCVCNPNNIPNARVIIRHNTSIPAGALVGTQAIIDIQEPVTLTSDITFSAAQLLGVSGARLRMIINALPTITNNTFVTTSGTIVEFAGGGGTIPNQFGTYYYKNLVIAGTGTKTPSGIIIIQENLNINSGIFSSPLTGLDSLSVAGTTTIASGATFSDGVNQNANSFGTIINYGTFTALGGGSNFSTFNFRGNIINHVGATFNTNCNCVHIFNKSFAPPLIITPNSPITFGATNLGSAFFYSDAIIADGSQVTFNIADNSSLTIANNRTVINNNTNVQINGDGQLNGADSNSKWLQGSGAVLNYASDKVPMSIGILDASTNDNTVNYNRVGNQSLKATIYRTLQLTNNSVKTIPAGTGNITIQNAFTIPAGVTFQVNDGNFTANADMVINGTWQDATSGGTSTFNTLTVETGGTLTVVGTNTSSYIFTGNITNKGNFNLRSNSQWRFNANLSIQNQSPTQMNFAESNSGTGQINGDVTILDGGAGAGNVALYTNIGIPISGSGTLTNELGNGTATGRRLILEVCQVPFTNASNAVVEYNASTDIPTKTCAAVDNIFVYRQNVSSVTPTTYYHIHFTNNSSYGLGGNITVNGNLLIESSATLNGGANTINIRGDWIGNGIFNSGTSTVIFDGTAAQTITTNPTSPFYNLNINNTASLATNRTVTLNNTIFIQNALILTQGRLVAGNHNINYFGTALNLTRTNGWVETNGTGLLVRNSIATLGIFDYPVGDATSAKNIRLSAIQNTGVRYVSPSAFPVPTFLQTNWLDGSWHIVSTNNFSTVLRVENPGGTTNTNSAIWQWNAIGNQWGLVATTFTSPNNFQTISSVALGTNEYFAVLSGVALEPTVQATNISFSSITAFQIQVSWTNGNGAKRLVVAKQGGPVTFVPTDGTTYTSISSNFGTSTPVASGEFVVYNGNANTFLLTGLLPNQTYHFRIFEYNDNGFAGLENYNTSTAIGNPNSATTFNIILLNNITPTTYCAGATTNVSFSCTGIFTSNTFIAQLSDAGGSFSSPIDIGALNTNVNGTNVLINFNVTFPSNLPTGNNYLIRIVATDGTQSNISNSLTINALPTITTHPANISSYAGETVTFSIVATGTGLTYQWQVSTDNGINFNNLIGQTNATLSLVITQAMNSYQYRCRVQNAEGCQIISNSAILLVGPALYPIPDANFRAWLVSNYPACMVTSKIDNLPRLNTNCNAVQNAVSVNITGQNISNLDGIQFFTSLQTLNASNNNLNTLPMLSNTLQTLNISQNQFTTLPVLPSGLLNLNLANNAIGFTLPNNFATQLPVLQTLNLANLALTALPPLPSTIIIGGLNVENNALDFFDLEPLVNKFTSPSQYSPQAKFVLQASISVIQGAPLNLAGLAIGSNNITLYQWFKDGQPITHPSNSSALTIPVIDLADNNKVLECRVTSTLSGLSGLTISSTGVVIEVIPENVPNTPTNLRVERDAQNRAVISWDWQNNVLFTRWFKIERSEGNAENFVEIVSANNNTTYIDANLTPNVTYFYRVRAANIAGNSDYTEAIGISLAPTTATALEQNWRQKVQIYPNPTIHNYIQIGIGEGLQGKISIDLINTQGTILKTTEFLLDGSTQSLNIELNDLPVGTYNLLITKGKQRILRQFVKTN